MITMQESYFHELKNGHVVTTDRLRSVARISQNRRIEAAKRGDDSVNLELRSADGSRVQDVLTADERVTLAKLLLSELPLDKVREALPAELFTTDWAFETTDPKDDEDPPEIWMSDDDGIVFATREAVVADLAAEPLLPGVTARILRREVSHWIEG